MNRPKPGMAVSPELVLVDDDPLTLEIVSWNTRQSPYAIHLFGDAEQALLHFQSRIPQLLIVDYYMPSMTGLEFLDKASHFGELENSVIYLCSAVCQSQLPERLSASLDVFQLDKQCVCDRQSLTALLDKHLA